MEVRAICSEAAAYRTMLAEVSALVDLDRHPDSPEGDGRATCAWTLPDPAGLIPALRAV